MCGRGHGKASVRSFLILCRVIDTRYELNTQVKGFE
jgi:hypothetical protein